MVSLQHQKFKVEKAWKIKNENKGIIEFDRDDCPIGDSRGLCSGLIGYFARNDIEFLINLKDWPVMFDEIKNDYFNWMLKVNILHSILQINSLFYSNSLLS